MAQQEEPLYDFPEPAQPSKCKFRGHQRGRASLKSISVLDRLLLTGPVWLQLSINPATALHILQREPPGTFLVRRSRTSQTNVLCVRLADDSMPSFVQQFGIREDGVTLCLEMSTLSFPDLPRLISFYCVSRDVLPLPLELPEAIAKASSHKELESISHMGIEFWSSHLNFRGPREAPKPQNDEKQKPDVPQAAPPQQGLTAQPESADLSAAPQPDTAAGALQPDHRPTLLDEFCPIRTRSPKELDCGAGQGALCFVNPLFLQPEDRLSRRRGSKHSFKVRVSMETSTMLSPPLAPPPPPPLLPKAKRGQARSPAAQEQLQPPSTSPGPWAGGGAQADDSDYLQPSPAINLTLSPYLSPSATPTLFPKGPPSLSPHNSPADSPSLSPYQSPSVSPKLPRSPGIASAASPYQSPSPSPKIPFSLSPFTSPSFVHLAEQAYHTPAAASAAASRYDQQGAVDEEARRDDQDNGTRREENEKMDGGDDDDEVLLINTARLEDTDSCNFFSSLEGAAGPQDTNISG